MFRTISTDEYIDLALRVLARSTAKQMGHAAYPEEWSRTPLNELLPLLFELLNYHPDKLGELIEDAYSKTFPESKRGNVNQLSSLHKDLFGNTEQSYRDQYLIEKLTDYSGGSARPSDRISPELMYRIAGKVFDIFSLLTPQQENEHRSLEQLVSDIYPLFTLNYELASIGFDVIEYSDFWRKMPPAERRSFASKITKEWPTLEEVLKASQRSDLKANVKSAVDFSIFSRNSLDALIDPFVPGMSQHITPIKYEALTPDLACFLFRTTGKDDKYYYFVLLEYDFIPELKIAKNIIAKWHGDVLDFVPPRSAQTEVTPSVENLSYSYDSIYKGLLARVERPSGDGYWAAHFVLKPGDDVDAALAHLSEEQQTAIKRGLSEIKNKDAKVSVYIKPEGGYELFFK